VTFPEVIEGLRSIFLDTAVVIYHIEAHPQYGPLAKTVVQAFQSGRLDAFSSVLTLAEVLPKPIQAGNEKLARRFAGFLQHGKNLSLIGISAGIAERAGRLRVKYPDLRAIDALQIAAAMDIGADAFLTNDRRLRRIDEINVLILKDYL